jgi:hypothetical protein
VPEDDRMVTFLDHRATLDGIVQKHVDLAANTAGALGREDVVDGSVYIFIFVSIPCIL